SRAAAQAAADAAALAGARAMQMGASKAEARTHARNYFKANTSEQIQGSELTVRFGSHRGETTVIADIAGRTDTSLLGVLGIDTVDYGVTAASVVPLIQDEITVLLDISHS